MKHSFDAEIANEYGVEIAIMFDMFCFWISKNEANNYNFQDGKHWTFNTIGRSIHMKDCIKCSLIGMFKR